MAFSINKLLRANGPVNNQKGCKTSSQKTRDTSSTRSNLPRSTWTEINERILSWLDNKILQENRKHFHLKNSERGYERYLWKKIYKPETSCVDYLTFTDKNPMKLFENTKINQSLVRKNANQIIHVFNYIDPKSIQSKSLKKRVELTLNSFKLANKNKTKLMSCSSIAGERLKWAWAGVELSRSARTEIGAPKDFAFLLDMLDTASDHCSENDYILYTNLDCPLSPDIYENLLNQNEDIIQYFVKEIDEKKYENLDQVYSEKYITKTTGVDGFAIKKGVYLCLRKYIPDLVIGEPHWDTVLWGIFKKFHYAKDNMTDLYHLVHEKAWNTLNLSVSGRHNELLYRDAYEYGIIDESLIYLEKQNILLVINDCGFKKCSNKLESILKNHPEHEIVFLDLVYGELELKTNLPEEVSYFPIKGNNKTINLDQRIPLMNIGAHLFLDRSNLSFMDIADEKIFHSISCSEYLKSGKFDYIKENNINENIIYLNDEGLLSEL